MFGGTPLSEGERQSGAGTVEGESSDGTSSAEAVLVWIPRLPFFDWTNSRPLRALLTNFVTMGSNASREYLPERINFFSFSVKEAEATAPVLSYEPSLAFPASLGAAGFDREI